MALQDLTPQLRTRLNRMERAVGWFVLLGLILFGPAQRALAVLSLIYPLTYMALSAAVTVRRRRAILRP